MVPLGSACWVIQGATVNVFWVYAAYFLFVGIWRTPADTAGHQRAPPGRV